MKSPLYAKFYASWLRETLPFGVRESLATCESCVMVAAHSSAQRSSCARVTRDPGPFRGDLKCCTHFPFIPNFVIGAILKDGQAGEKRAMREAVEKGDLSPLGLNPSEEYVALKNALGESAFGREVRLLCPMYDREKNGCSIWSFRPGVCSSYFCESEAAQEGLLFWEGVEEFLNLFEWTLAHEALWQLGFTQDEINSRSWCEYQDQKDQLFLKAYENSLKVSSKSLQEILGEEGQHLLQKIHKSRQAFSGAENCSENFD